MDERKLYNLYVKWEEDLFSAKIKLSWNETGSMNAVMPENYVLPHTVSSGNIDITCPSGYGIQASDPSSCTEVCGDGILTTSETCDDKNTANNDGCSSDCQAIEYNYICVYNSGIPGHECSSCGASGYPNAAKDTCELCSPGFQHIPSYPDTCTEICGDGIQTSGEVCDDGNSASGDGCSADCKAIEFNYICVYDPGNARDVCTSCSSTEIPNSDFTACVPCENGYSHKPESPNECTPVCGDGFRVTEEACDDNNTVSGDGCSADCSLIEDQHICVTNQTLSKDVCTLCSDLQTPNSNKTKCDAKSVDPLGVMTPTTTSAVATSVMATSVASSSATILVSAGSSQSVFSAVNQFQLLLLFPLLRLHLPELVVNFYGDLNWSMGSVEFISLDDIPYANELWSPLSAEQTDEILNIVGIQNKSTFINILSVFCILVIVVAFHLLFLVLYLITRKQDSDNKLASWIEKKYKNFVFNVYIRMILETMMIGSISCLTEIKASDTSTVPNIVSLAISCMLIVLYIFIILFNFVVWTVNKNKEQDQISHRFSEFFDGVRHTKYARLYLLCDSVRKIALVSMLILTTWASDLARIVSFIVIQCAFFAYIFIVKPFDMTRDNLREILNELMVAFYSVFFLKYRSESDWSDRESWIYIGVAIFNIMTGSVIGFTCLIIDIRSKCKNQNPLPSIPQHKIFPVNPPIPTQNTSTISKTNPSSMLQLYRHRRYSCHDELDNIQPKYNPDRGFPQRLFYKK
ncbi:unnamed protein product [Moneuplotes crassus]|uniref:Uncharacterized protein n=1 Tax=Euplotes crassus TaxID=5936 RepID=A0AAD2DAC2_EUPCR|nr:unnamed protein product [Moneuplotes crassus]